MKDLARKVPAKPFFLKADVGERFCLYHSPDPGGECHGAFIYIHPFGDEMNKSRRMAAMQARAFAAMGFGVLQMDLFGCGDSSGEFRDARWDIWKGDLAAARNWIGNHVAASVSLWGLRLGGLLALDFAMDPANEIDKIILWQPVLSGKSFMNQFLRLRIANEILADSAGAASTTGTDAMRRCLKRGETLEVAGYELAPDLAAAIDSLKATELVVARSTIHWFEIVAESSRSMTQAGAKVVNEWKTNGVDLRVHLVRCAPFWATQEIAECTELVSATADVNTIAAL